MKLLFDQNISFRILKNLPELFKNSSHIKKEGLENKSDKEIWEFAKNNNFTIVTQDSDFNELNALYGFPPKIIWIRIGNVKTQEIISIIDKYKLAFIEFDIDFDYGCFEIIKL